jgi:hypothetical protein
VQWIPDQVRDDSRNRRGTTDNAFRKTQILLIDLLTDLLIDLLTDLLTYAIAKTLLTRFIAPHLLRCAARSPHATYHVVFCLLIGQAWLGLSLFYPQINKLSQIHFAAQ